MALKVDFTFDENTYRHYMNGILSVLHCHHYMSITTKLAEQFADCGGPKILEESAEDSVRPLFDDYFKKENVSEVSDRLKVGADFYALMGLGKMELEGKEQGGIAQLNRSHVDEGWIKKWGKRESGMNYFTRGFIAAIFAATFDRAARSYSVKETASIVAGDPKTQFEISLGS